MSRLQSAHYHPYISSVSYVYIISINYLIILLGLRIMCNSFADISMIFITLNALERVALVLFLRREIKSMAVIMLLKGSIFQTGKKCHFSFPAICPQIQSLFPCPYFLHIFISVMAFYAKFR